MSRVIILMLLVVGFCESFAKDVYVGGAGASDNNPGTSSQPFATIQKAASVAVAGDIIKIRAGTYRETIVPANSGSAGNPVIYQPDNGATVIISGNNPITTPWTVHSGNIYKTSVTLPVNGHQSRITTNTTILSNQIFDDGAMQFEARWPKISKEADLLDITKMRHISKTTSFNPTSLTDPGLVSIPGGLTGAKLVCTGWFLTNSRIITSQGGNTLNYSNIHAENFRFRKYYYVTGKLGLLSQAKEWHYESGTLYFWQEGGGSPAGLEYKARNWGFDLRGKSGITIAGLQFFACEPMTGDTNSNNIVIDNIKAKYTNHAVMQDISVWPGYGNAQQTGIKLIGANCVIKNSEIQYVASHGIWLGQNGKAENNLIQDISYEGNWGAGVSVWGSTGGQLITRNTIRRTGRSCIDLGYSYTPHGVSQNLNMNIGYNDISMFGMLNIDLGGIYGWGFRNTAGSRIHHNWVHDSGVVPDPTGIPLDGIQTGTYFDQASGPFTLDHNVYWNNHHNLSQDAADHYTQPNFEHRNAGSSLLYNNTFASAAPKSYVTYVASPLDIQKNNIYHRDININWTPSNGNTTNCLLEGVNPQFMGNGQGGLFYRLKAGSPGINGGVEIPGITDGSSGAPDIGAYEYGGEAWVPGYTPQASVPIPNTPPVVTITAPANNASFKQGSPITISANASDTNGTITKVEFFNGTTKLGEDASSPYSFIWNNAAVGTHTITVKATDNATTVTTSAPISITVNTTVVPVVAITSPASNAQFAAGFPITIMATASDANGSVTKVEFFNGTTKLGEDLSSPYNFVWSNATTGTHIITVKATDNENNVTTSTAITIVVGTSAAPTVSITSPSNNGHFTTGVPIAITATASDANGTVTKVEFFSGATKIGQDVTSPYSFVWSSATAGTHILTAKATDNQNNVTTSVPVSITVGDPNAPSVSITSPLNNAKFTPGAALTLTATASDADGSIAKVEFFNGAVKLGEDLTFPYSFIWNELTTGDYTITAKATDNLGAVGISLPVNIFVLNDAINSVVYAGQDVSLNLPDNSVTLKANVEEIPDGPQLDFNWTKESGPDADFNPFLQEIQVTNLVEGIYVFAITVTDGNGTVVGRDEIIITVIAGSDLQILGDIPRSFSPNGDGHDDLWIWPNTKQYENSILTVFNQSGQIVYEAMSYKNNWDGTLEGQPLQPGQYQYVIRLKDAMVIKASLRIIY